MCSTEFKKKNKVNFLKAFFHNFVIIDHFVTSCGGVTTVSSLYQWLICAISVLKEVPEFLSWTFSKYFGIEARKNTIPIYAPQHEWGPFYLEFGVKSWPSLSELLQVYKRTIYNLQTDGWEKIHNKSDITIAIHKPCNVIYKILSIYLIGKVSGKYQHEWFGLKSSLVWSRS